MHTLAHSHPSLPQPARRPQPHLQEPESLCPPPAPRARPSVHMVCRQSRPTSHPPQPLTFPTPSETVGYPQLAEPPLVPGVPVSPAITAWLPASAPTLGSPLPLSLSLGPGLGAFWLLITAPDHSPFIFTNPSANAHLCRPYHLPETPHRSRGPTHPSSAPASVPVANQSHLELGSPLPWI